MMIKEKEEKKILKSIYINYDQEKLFNKKTKTKTIFEITNLRRSRRLNGKMMKNQVEICSKMKKWEKLNYIINIMI